MDAGKSYWAILNGELASEDTADDSKTGDNVSTACECCKAHNERREDSYSFVTW